MVKCKRNYNGKSFRFQKRGQWKIQQMAFMIVAVFLFFILVGLFFLTWQYKDIKASYSELQKESAISSLAVISDMVELNCDSKESFCLDLDKVEVMQNFDYSEFWPVESVKVYKIYSGEVENTKQIKCPATNCNYYEVYNSGDSDKEYSTYVSLCKKLKQAGRVYEKCEIGKLVAGVKDG